jgi:hypothetical protein
MSAPRFTALRTFLPEHFMKEAAMPNEPLPDDIRRIWQNQPLENNPMPLEEIHRRARQFEKRISRRNLREYIAGGIGIVIFTVYLFIFRNPVARTGSALIIAGALFVLFQIYKRATPGTLPADLALTASLEFHRRELVRQRDLLRTVWLWYLGPFIPGIVVFGMGVAPRHGTASWWDAAPFLSIVGAVMWLNYRAAQGLDRQIAEIDNLEN